MLVGGVKFQEAPQHLFVAPLTNWSRPISAAETVVVGDEHDEPSDAADDEADSG